MKCSACEYDLRAHTEAERCPECGQPVADTVQDRRPKPQHEAAIAVYLVASILLGFGGSFMIFGAAWASFELFLVMAFCAGIAPACASGAISASVFRQRHHAFLATSYAWPMLGLGMTCLLHVPAEGPGMLVWLGIGIAMFLSALAGFVVARRMMRKRRRGPVEQERPPS